MSRNPGYRLALASLALTAPLTGQERFPTTTASGCLPCARRWVSTCPWGAAWRRKSGSPRSGVQTMVESRLRAARLYTAEEDVPFLWVGIFPNDDGPAFVIRLSFAKLVYDYYLSGLERGATTWESGETLGQHGGDAGFIMQALSEDLDLFILEYLRVNEGYC